MTSIAVFIVAPVRLYREGLRDALSARAHLTVVGVAADITEAHPSLSSAAPDVLLLDMATRGALELMSELRRVEARTKVVAFAVHEEEAEIMACVEAGAMGYLTCDSSIDDIVEVIERVNCGELPCSPRVAGMFLRRLNKRTPAGERPIEPLPLSAREQQVVRLICGGLSNKEIGQTLHIAEATVKNHVHNLLEKLRVTTRTQAVALLSKTPNF